MFNEMYNNNNSIRKPYKRVVKWIDSVSENNLKNKVFVIAGGVAANKKIRADLKNLSNRENIKFYVPTLELCTDNGAMIAWAGFERYRLKKDTMFNFKPRPRWPLDPNAHLINPIHQNIGKSGAKA